MKNRLRHCRQILSAPTKTADAKYRLRMFRLASKLCAVCDGYSIHSNWFVGGIKQARTAVT
jgi:hypothetical protein